MSEQPQFFPMIHLIAEDGQMIAYRPKLAALTGSVTSAILLQQILHHFKMNGYQPFYKFKEPCAHDLYRPGDSWCEELAYTRAEFDGAIVRIATKIRRGLSKHSALEWELPLEAEWEGDPKGLEAAFLKTVEHFVVYWTDSSHQTWYEVNTPLLDSALGLLYAKAEIPLYLDKAKKRLYLDNGENPLYLSLSKNRSSKTPGKTGKPRPRNLVFDAIALGSYNLENVTPKAGKKIGTIASEVCALEFGEIAPTPQQKAALAADLKAMYSWYKSHYPHLSAPGGAVTICKYLREWRELNGQKKGQGMFL
jgi:hypothetical protein